MNLQVVNFVKFFIAMVTGKVSLLAVIFLVVQQMMALLEFASTFFAPKLVFECYCLVCLEADSSVVMMIL